MNTNHTIMKENLRYFINDLKVDPSQVINLEAKPYVNLYIRGSEAYNKKDYDRTTNYMELSLVEYLQAEEECRAQCEGPFDQGWFPDFISSISSIFIYFSISFWVPRKVQSYAFFKKTDHYTFTLRCKRKCAKNLENLNGAIHSDLLPSHYHYLQFAYFKGRTKLWQSKYFHMFKRYIILIPGSWKRRKSLSNSSFLFTLFPWRRNHAGKQNFLSNIG